MKSKISEIRIKLIDTAILNGIILLLPFLFFSFIRYFQIGWINLYIVHISVAAFLFTIYLYRKKLSYEFKVHSYSILYGLISFFGIIYFGYSGFVGFYFLGVLLNALILGKKTSIIYAVATVISIIIAYAILESGITKLAVDLDEYNTKLTTWLSHTYVFVYISVILIYTVSLYNKFFLSSFNALNKKVEEIQLAEKELIIAKKAAEESEIKFSTIFNYAPVIIALLDYDNLKFVDVNKEFVRVSGYKYDEIIGKSPVETGWLEEENWLQVKELLNVSNSYEIDEIKARKKSGELVVCSCRGEIICILGKKYLLSIEQDITQIKRTEIDLIQAKEKAEESATLKTAFLNNISHEIRTPLNAISGFAQLITKPNKSTERLKSYSELITKSSSKLISIVDDILEISEVMSNKVQCKYSEFYFSDVVDYVKAENIEAAAEKNIEIDISYSNESNSITVISDLLKVKRILFHLVDNAIKFTETGNVKIEYSVDSNGFEFSVSDTGIGISDEMKKVIFEPFRQAEVGISRNYGGVGLGLSLVHAYTIVLKGVLTMESQLLHGTVFRLSFPNLNSSEIKQPNKMARQGISKTKTILIAEDDLSNFLFLKELLRDFELEILYAKNGQQAVDIFNDSLEIGLVLMDLKMPVLDGYEAAKSIKSTTRNVTIIAFTAHNIDEENISDLGLFDDIILKPIKESELIEKIRDFLHSNG